VFFSSIDNYLDKAIHYLIYLRFALLLNGGGSKSVIVGAYSRLGIGSPIVCIADEDSTVPKYCT
jgi:hypothetical protein